MQGGNNITQDEIEEEEDSDLEEEDDQRQDGLDLAEDDDDEDEYGDVMNVEQSQLQRDNNEDQMQQQMKAKFKFKIGSINGGTGLGRGAGNLVTSSTSYGNKFIDLRKTFQNFNANSNKVLQTATELSQQNHPNSSYGGGSSSVNKRGNQIVIAGGHFGGKQSFVTHYGVSFKEAFNKK